MVVGELLSEMGQLAACKEILSIISRFSVKVDPSSAAGVTDGVGDAAGVTDTVIVSSSANTEYQHVLTRALMSLGRLLLRLGSSISRTLLAGWCGAQFDIVRTHGYTISRISYCSLQKLH